MVFPQVGNHFALVAEDFCKDVVFQFDHRQPGGNLCDFFLDLLHSRSNFWLRVVFRTACPQANVAQAVIDFEEQLSFAGDVVQCQVIEGGVIACDQVLIHAQLPELFLQCKVEQIIHLVLSFQDSRSFFTDDFYCAVLRIDANFHAFFHHTLEMRRVNASELRRIRDLDGLGYST